MNPGIVKTVEWLNANGFKTTDSGDGETHEYECDQEQPYVHMIVTPLMMLSEANRLRDLLLGKGIQLQPMDEHCSVQSLELSYNVAENFAVLSLWNVKL